MTKPWSYPSGTPQYEPNASLVGWIAGSGNANGSVASWRTEERSRYKKPFEAAKGSISRTTTAQRATLAALVGVLEAAGPCSNVLVFTRSEYVSNVLSNIANWQSQGWEGTDGPLANRDILERIAYVIQSRSLQVEGRLVSKGDDNDRIIERLIRKARAMLRELVQP